MKTKIRKWLIAVVSMGFAVTSATMVAAPAYAAPCPNVEVVFARGTFEPPGIGATGQAFVDSLTAKTPNKTVEVYPVDYPASIDFAAAADGVIDASNKVKDTAATCPARRSSSAATHKAPRWRPTSPRTPFRRASPCRPG